MMGAFRPDPTRAGRDGGDGFSKKYADLLNSPVARVKMTTIGVYESLDRYTTADRTLRIKKLSEKIVVVRQLYLTIKQATSGEPHFTLA
jgi:hypothetical protein